MEQLRLGKSDCTTALGGTGVSDSFPPTGAPLNGASVVVSCGQIGDGAEDTQGWAAIVTGGADEQGEFYVHGPIDKKFGGRMYVYNKTKFRRTQGDLTIQNGDLWYRDGDCSSSTFPTDTALHFEPAGLRGPLCTEAAWQSLFSDTHHQRADHACIAFATLGRLQGVQSGQVHRRQLAGYRQQQRELLPIRRVLFRRRRPRRQERDRHCRICRRSVRRHPIVYEHPLRGTTAGRSHRRRRRWRHDRSRGAAPRSTSIRTANWKS